MHLIWSSDAYLCGLSAADSYGSGTAVQRYSDPLLEPGLPLVRFGHFGRTEPKRNHLVALISAIQPRSSSLPSSSSGSYIILTTLN